MPQISKETGATLIFFMGIALLIFGFEFVTAMVAGAAMVLAAFALKR